MNRLAVQILFVVIGIAWLLFTMYDLFIQTFGGCVEVELCTAYKNAAGNLVLWRGLCVAIMIAIAYGFFRKDPDV